VVAPAGGQIGAAGNHRLLKGLPIWIAMCPDAPYILSLTIARVPVPQLHMPQPMQSPCTRVCTIDEATGLCAGCGRTLEEIVGWSRMTDDERQRIMSSLPDRRGQDRGTAGR
jgi:uncharacterized protein